MENKKLKNLIIAKIDKLLKQGYVIGLEFVKGYKRLTYSIDRFYFNELFIDEENRYFLEYKGKFYFYFDLGQENIKEIFEYVASKYSTDEFDVCLAENEAKNYLKEELDGR